MKEYGRLQINLLGAPEVWLDGTLVTSFSTAKTAALLYFLAATQQTHSRERLAGLLWSEMPEAKARRNLTKSLSVLRRLLDSFLLIEPQRVGFDPAAPVELDLSRFAAAVSSPDPSPDAVTVYRGDFLEGFFVKDARAFEEWLLTEREKYRETAVGALAILAARASSSRDYASGIAFSRRLLALDPWRESTHRQLMLLLARQGQQAAALAQYEQCREVLAEELGVEPMPETTALYHRIQIARRDRPYHLPAPATPFLGRKTELAQIGQLLADPACRLLTLVGLGGIGKTRLALAAARQANREQAWQFLHGVLFVSLTSVASPDLLPTAIADILELCLDGRQDPVNQLNHYLHDKEILIVLDNFEHLLAATSILARILRASPDVKFLITSRDPLQIEAEHRFDVGGLPFPTEDPVSVSRKPSSDVAEPDTGYGPRATEYAAVQLFLQAARQVRPGFEHSAAVAADVMRICRILGGVPLAIKLAASWLRVLTCAEIAAEIERGLDLLETSMRDVPPRQRSMTAVFDYSWGLLSAVEQECLSKMSVFRGGFSNPAAREIAGASLRVLAGLSDRALLHSENTAAGTRYYLHELTRQYAADKLAQVPETAVSVRHAHARYFARQLEALTPALSGPEPQRAYELLHQEIGNVRSAWQHALEELDRQSLSVMVEPFARFLGRQGWFDEGRERLTAAIAALQAANHDDKTSARLLGSLLARQASLVGRIGQYDDAEAALRQSIDYAWQGEDPKLLAFAQLEFGALLRDQSRFEEAAAAFREGLDIAEELNDRPLVARAMEKLGLITWDQGSHLAAQARLREALELFRELQNMRQIGNTLNSLGNVTMSLGDNRAALAYYQEALPIARELENSVFLDTVLINLGMVSNNLGLVAESRRYYEESLEICRRIGDEIGGAYCLTGLAQACMEEADLAQAHHLLEQSLSLNRQMGRDRYIAINLNLLGDVAQLGGDLARAKMLYTESLAVSEAIPHRWGMASSRLRLGDVAVAEKEEVAAADHYLAALTLGREIDAQGIMLTALANLATRLLNRGEAETAVLVLHIVANQPAVSDSLRQTIADQLARDSANIPTEKQRSIEAKAGTETLDAAIAIVRSSLSA